MTEAISFWLDNKMSSGIRVAENGAQTLILYREKYYVVENGAALMKGSKPLHYSKSSIPTLWRKVMRGIVPVSTAGDDDQTLPVATVTGKRRTKTVNEPFDTQPVQDSAASAPTLAETEPVPADNKKTSSLTLSSKSRASSPAAKTRKQPVPAVALPKTVNAACPYCGCKHELPLDKGKNGKAFLVCCSRCSGEFAVRFVPVTTYQAQVAAFS